MAVEEEMAGRGLLLGRLAGVVHGGGGGDGARGNFHVWSASIAEEERPSPGRSKAPPFLSSTSPVHRSSSPRTTPARAMATRSFLLPLKLGENISDKDRCLQCKGSKVTREKKLLGVNVEKGLQPCNMARTWKIVFQGQADEVISVFPIPNSALQLLCPTKTFSPLQSRRSISPEAICIALGNLPSLERHELLTAMDILSCDSTKYGVFMTLSDDLKLEWLRMQFK
ncbi:Chaperone protein dnaJ 3 [Platanthera guangdongensis]|uniref:Chaperone protein dnaJ 3 n=1 Tax=Platanthera guangdongensis TaxID=2320717 RepID=A0ABR2LMT8_9ASPA